MKKSYLIMENIILLFFSYILSLLLVKYTLSVLMIRYAFSTQLSLSVITCIFMFFFLFFMLKEIHLTDIIFWMIVIVICVLYCWTLKRPAISFDTWQVYDMSRYLSHQPPVQLVV